MGTLEEVNKTFNQHGCIQILDEDVLSFSYLLCENRLMDKLSFQYDVADITVACSKRKSLLTGLMSSPRSSAIFPDPGQQSARICDLGSIENLSDYLKQKVKRNKRHPSNIRYLRKQLLIEVLQIDANIIRMFIHSFP